MKPRIYNGTDWIEFETQAEHDAYVQSISPTPDLTQIKNQIIREQKGRELANDLFVKLNEQNLTDAEEAQVINKISTVMVALIAGSLRGARIICNALTTDAVFNNARKNYLLNQIDKAITEI